MDENSQTVVEDIFRTIFELETKASVESINRYKSPTWDSMAHVALISALDDEFDIVMDTQDALKIDSFASCISIVDQYNV